MGAGQIGLKNVLLASILAVTTPLTALHAAASTHRHKRPATHDAAAFHEHVRKASAHHTYVHGEAVHRPYVLIHPEYEHHGLGRHLAHLELAHGGTFHHRRVAYHHWVARGISCVPFARSDSGINLVGNAWTWWSSAAGVYARGRVPQLGSVLAFRSNPHMRLGHVAVVSRIVNSREIEIDQANWGRGAVSRDVPVVDVSEANDWTAVRVGLSRPGEFGAVYPTYGFIYDRPDNGVITAAATTPAPQAQLNPVPRDLRPAVERPWKTYEEVAEAPESRASHRSVVRRGRLRRGLDLSFSQ